MNTIKLLWQLQEIEKKEKELSQGCRVNPLFQDLKITMEEISVRRQKFESLKEQYKILAQEIKASEEETKNLLEKQKDILKKMYDGSITQPKELSKMQQLSVQMKNQATNEDELLIAKMEEKENRAAFLREEQKLLMEEIQKYRVGKMEYDAEKLNTEHEITQLGEGKEKIIAKIPKEAMKRYNGLQKSFSGSSISIVNENRLCSFCRVELTRAIVERAKATPGRIYCESCGRVLYVS